MDCLQLLEASSDGIEIGLLEFNFEAMPSAHDWSLLSTEEKIRAQCFYQLHDQKRFVTTRAALRRLLAQYVMESPHELCISAGQYGKPHLQRYPSITFNVSHAGDFALIALSTRGEVGVDIEQCHRDVKGLDRYVLSPLERALKLWSDKHFIELWVTKEAILKALGFGIAEYLQAITVVPKGDGSYCIAYDRPEWAKVSAWSIAVPADYSAAVALINQSESSPLP